MGDGTTKTEEELRAIRMANIEPHKFPQGTSGNPKGRPKGKTIASEIKRIIRESEDEGSDVVEALARVAIAKALKGDYRFFESVREQIDGQRSGSINAKVQIVIGDLSPPDDWDPPQAPVQVKNTAGE